ncbi:uncharacterized protein PV09_08800 [Verruconis gallopava]|uniref:Uncharacterized protein n=1 Tax=Verruconis gallopava TaxID=253628 RepID=A0A0D1ZZP7_9PEZI|nr:uncharacterized protein PV09_08800 [Verruconis gallopava]KIV99494.1 hypothetical protein PV09_08800 [Verruconis gallopava]
MGDFVPPPRPRELIPPLLACLPTAFVSPRPPPALLPLLSPILRQRVHLLSATSSTSDNWLALLSWDSERASKLPNVVERIHIEPHPVSGEIEIEDPKRILYRRLDSETLHSQLQLEGLELIAVYLWCLGNGGPNEKGWKLAELRSLEDVDDGTTWYGSISEANEHADIVLRSSQSNNNSLRVTDGTNARKDSPRDEDDDDSYWAAYDRTPGRTPSVKRSPAPDVSSLQLPTATELEYFARYVSEIQPAMDPEDPDEAALEPHESTLNGHIVIPQLQAIPSQPFEARNFHPKEYDSSLQVEAALPNGVRQEDEMKSPKPRSRSSSPVEKLEQRARSVSSAEFGIKQHISTDIKSLYRLAKSAGIDREEFDRIVRTELDVLSFMDDE